MVNQAIQDEDLIDILPETVQPNGSVYIGRDRTGMQAIVILLEKETERVPTPVAGTATKPAQ